MNPSLIWKHQFKVMKEKLNISIIKVINIDMNEFQAYIYFNMYMIRSIFFGARVIELKLSKTNKLKK